MNIGLIILCRYNSRRLPGKIFKKVKGLSILQHIVNRLDKVNLPIVVATSNENSDNIILDYCRRNKITCFRGSLQNVSERFLRAGQAFNFDYIVRINGDNLFIDLDCLKKMISMCKTDNYDFISNVKDRTYPYGMSIEIVNLDFYKKTLNLFTDNKLKEHVTLYFYQNAQYGKQLHYRNEKYKEANGLKFAIDEAKDLELVRKMALQINFNNYNLKELIEVYNNL